MKRISSLLILCFAVSALSAQVSQQVEVTKAYVPHVGQARKLAVQPRMTDTVALRPTVEYTTVPRTWSTEFEARRIRPASVSSNPYHVSGPFYIKAAVGYPLRSVLDAYVSKSDDNGSTVGAFLKHYGSYSKRKNDYDAERNKATWMDNAAGVFGSKDWGRYSLDGSLAYENRLAYRYGVFALDSVIVQPEQKLMPENVSDRMADLGALRGDVRFGSSFTDMSRFNFAVGLGAAFMHDAACDRQVDIDAFARIGRMYGAHGFDFKVDYDGYIGAVALRSAGVSGIGVGPKYVLRTPKVNLSVGADYVYTHDGIYGDRHNIFPAVDLRLDVVKGYFIPYFTAGGDVVSGSFFSMARRNPYLSAGSVAPSGRRIDLRVGIEGGVKETFLYRVFAGYSSFRRIPFFVSLYMPAGADDTGRFGVFSDDADMFTAGAELQLSLSRSFEAEYRFGYYGCNTDMLPHGGGVPKYDMSLALRYSYRDKFSISLSAVLTGARYFPEIDARSEQGSVWTDFSGTVYTSRVPATVDLGVDVDFRITEKLWVFVNGTNLAAARLYTFNHYRELGAGVMAGVKVVF